MKGVDDWETDTRQYGKHVCNAVFLFDFWLVRGGGVVWASLVCEVFVHGRCEVVVWYFLVAV